jgi:hypothetical protein
MTARPDAELEVLFCERVLGWHRGAYGDWFDSADQFVRSAIYPLHSHDDAFAGLRAHADWRVGIWTSVDEPGWNVGIHIVRSMERGAYYCANDPDLCRAIVLASCRAVGCDV